jgi:gluconolactonase
MRCLPGVLLAVALSSAAVAENPSTPAAPPAPDASLEMTAAGIPGVIAPGTKTQLVHAGFNGTEGVISMPDGSVLFCELNENRVVHIDLSGQFSTYLDDTNRAIGLAFDAKGRLIAAQSRNPRIGVLAPTRTILAESFEGQPLVRPNDLVVDRKGGIYFSDPIPPAQVQFRDPPPGRKPLIFYITPKGKVTKLTQEVTHPNGLELSTNEQILYAVDADHIAAADVQPNGSIRNLRTFAEVAGGDGLAVDSQDRLYVATEGGVQVVSPNGQVLGLIPTPVRLQSIAFAGADHKTLYAAGRGAVYRIPLLVRGVRGRAK